MRWPQRGRQTMIRGPSRVLPHERFVPVVAGRVLGPCEDPSGSDTARDAPTRRPFALPEAPLLRGGSVDGGPHYANEPILAADAANNNIDRDVRKT